MKNKLACAGIILLACLGLSGCSSVGNKSASMGIVYAAMAVLSALALLGYSLMIRKKTPWVWMLFGSITVVNCGYFLLASVETLEAALFANRVCYLGSVFLPLSMLMILLQVCKFHYPKRLPLVLILTSILMFLITASPGYLPIYYAEVSLEFVDGVAVLNKVYGPLHRLYLFYLLFHFGAMVFLILRANIKKQLHSGVQAVLLAAATFVNILVWLAEQLVHFDFEFLSVSYVISELFLLGLFLMMQEQERLLATAREAALRAAPPAAPQAAPHAAPASKAVSADACTRYREGILHLTPTERAVLQCYTEGKTTKETLDALNIKENTLKYHNKNLYGKLGVSSRKQLLEVAAACKE